MQITVNGESRDVASDASVLCLLDSLGLSQKTVVVQRNDDVVERDEYAATKLQEGDVLNLVRFVGGG